MALAAEWQNVKKTWGPSFHPMCSYMAMFPPRIPHYFIQKYTNEGDVVLDPFSGRGTTATQACYEGRIGIGNDLNPLAYILTKAKTNPPDYESLMSRLRELEENFIPPEQIVAPDDIKMIFHNDTLSQLQYMKNNLNRDKKEDIFILASLSGIMHGKSVGYLSVDMPNTFSMSPNYLKNYINKNGLIKPQRNVFAALRKKFLRLYSDGIPNTKGISRYGDVRTLHELYENEDIKKRGIKLILTSPPYLKVIKYGMYNWIRLWLLDAKSDEVDEKLDDTHGLEKYLEFMKDTMRVSHDLLRNDGVGVYVIGDVAKKGKATINLAEMVWEHCAKPSGFKLKTIIEDKIKNNTKVTKIWSKTKGNATKTDRILVVYKEKYKELKENIEW